MIYNEICKTCGGKCCKGEILGVSRCKWLTSEGCNLCILHKSPTCMLYPYILVDDRRFPNHHRVFLDTGCPYWREFVNNYQDVPHIEELYSLVVISQSIQDYEEHGLMIDGKYV